MGHAGILKDLEEKRKRVAKFVSWARAESGTDYRTIERELFIPRELYMKWERGEESPRLNLLFSCMKLFGPRYVREALSLIYTLQK